MNSSTQQAKDCLIISVIYFIKQHPTLRSAKALHIKEQEQ